VAAARVALNLKRGEKQAPSTDEVLAELAALEPDPELAHLKRLYRAELGAALSEALAELPARQRAVLRLHYVDGLRLAQIGALYRAHESTVSRWVSAALSSVAAAAKRRLVERLALSASGVESIARLVQSQLDLSVRRILSQAGDEGGS